MTLNLLQKVWSKGNTVRPRRR